MEKKIRVFAPNNSPEGVQFFRLFQPLMSIDNEITLSLVRPDYHEGIVDLGMTNHILFQSTPDSGARKVMETLKKASPNLKFVTDFDDMITEIEPTNDAYALVGTEEVVVEMGDTGHSITWVDKQSSIFRKGEEILFDIERNRKTKDDVLWIMRNSDALTTTTEYLANKLRKFNKNVYVIPNAIDQDIYNPIEYDNDKVRIGWMYSSSHLVDWLDLSDGLRRIVNENDNVELVLFADDYPPLNGIKKEKIILQKYTSILNGYHEVFANLKIDIGLCHIMDTDFNKCKSPVKWEEYSALNICTLAPKTMYENFIEDGVTGLLYDGTQENKRDFVDKLNYLIKRKKLRKELAKNASAEIMQNYNIDKIKNKYLNVFKGVLK